MPSADKISRVCLLHTKPDFNIIIPYLFMDLIYFGPNTGEISFEDNGSVGERVKPKSTKANLQCGPQRQFVWHSALHTYRSLLPGRTHLEFLPSLVWKVPQSSGGNHQHQSAQHSLLRWAVFPSASVSVSFNYLAPNHRPEGGRSAQNKKKSWVQ